MRMEGASGDTLPSLLGLLLSRNTHLQTLNLRLYPRTQSASYFSAAMAKNALVLLGRWEYPSCRFQKVPTNAPSKEGYQ
jgi:hypothetical protein